MILLDHLQQQKKAKKHPKILDGKYYTIQSSKSGDIKATCKDCLVVKNGTCTTIGNFQNDFLDALIPRRLKNWISTRKSIAIIHTIYSFTFCVHVSTVR